MILEEPIEKEALRQCNWYRCGKSMQEFHDSAYWIRVLVGGRGSGKSTGVCIEAIRHGWNYGGAKILLVRKTEASQADSTIDTHNICYANFGDLYRETDVSLFKRWNDGKTVRLPSRKAVEEYNRLDRTFKNKAKRLMWLDSEGNRLCSFVEMRGLPNAGVSESKLRGFECSMLVLVEADQISFNDYKLSLACLRWKGSDPATCDDNGFIIDTSVILDTNPPSPKHWIAQLEEDEQEKPESDREMEFWHLSTYENEHNLPPEYIKRQILLPYAKNPAMIERMLWGRYADAFEGTPVYHAYEIAKHEYRGLGWPKGATLICGMDVGNTNASIISALKTHGGHEYLWTMREIVLTDSDTDRQCIELLKVLAREFPWWNAQNDVCPQSLFFVDPAAAGHRVFTQNGLTDALKVIQSHGIFPQYKMSERGLQPTIAIGNRMLNQFHIDDHGKTVHHFKIDPDRCPKLCNALRGGYRYPSPGETGYGSNKPLKGDLCDNLDHPCFVAGTKIITARGELPIEQVCIGDLALTRNGFRTVIATGDRMATVKDYTFTNGTKTTSTLDHPYWSREKKIMIAVDFLTHEDTLTECNPIQKLLSLTGKFIAGILTRNAEANESISKTTPHTCITSSGRCTTAHDQKDSTSTTSTRIRPTTTSKISNCSPRKSTDNFTLLQSVEMQVQPDAQRLDLSQRLGTHQRPVTSGTPTTQPQQDSESNRSRSTPAKTAEPNSPLQHQQESRCRPDSAPTNARLHTAARPAWMTWIALASIAARLSRLINIQSRNAAPRFAQCSAERTERVYNITVERDHEYFANGILVSNCDAWRYGYTSVLKLAKENYSDNMTAAPRGTGNIEPRREI